MISFGIKSSELVAEKIKGKCSYCVTDNNMQLFVFQKYFHIMWIPFFPLDKITATQCSHCKQVLDNNDLSKFLTYENQHIEKKVKTPLWTFLGPFLIILAIVSFTFEGIQNTKKKTLIINSPKSGDVYQIAKKKQFIYISKSKKCSRRYSFYI